MNNFSIIKPMLSLIALTLPCLLITNTVQAADSTEITPISNTQLQYCCKPNAPTLAQDYDYQNHGDARYWDQDCSANQSGNEGASHAGYTNDVISGVFADYGSHGQVNIGAKCSHIQATQYCSWVPTGTCLSSSSYTPNPSAPT